MLLKKLSSKKCELLSNAFKGAISEKLFWQSNHWYFTLFSTEIRLSFEKLTALSISVIERFNVTTLSHPWLLVKV